VKPVKSVKQAKPEKEKIWGFEGYLLVFAKLTTTMSNSDTFEDLIVWQESIKLAKDVFILFENCKTFSLKNQIERAAISVSANIAEGYELDTNKQCVKHLFISKASCGEVRSLLILAKELKLYPEKQIDSIINSSSKLSIMIYNFIRARGGRK